jgi:hypothetical protein
MPNAVPHDGGLGQRRVEDALCPELGLQAIGRPEDAAELADVLTHDDDALVASQRLRQGAIDRLDHEHFGHALTSPS